MDTHREWRFASNQNSVIVGINDAGIETFSAHTLRSLVRESIQNSLDAKIEVSLEPVKVEFSQFEIAFKDFPDVDKFKGILQKCLNSNRDESAAKDFFGNALNIMAEPIKVLRISDYNTFGLRGSDTCAKGTAWSRLVKESGSSNKENDSGGSFGIGKSAMFACSDLRTVLYSSLDDTGLKSSIGVARLISYEDSAGEWTTGTGYYSEDDKFTAIHEMCSLEPKYERSESGTDVFILGVSEIDDFNDEIILSVLMNFFISIIKKKLIVCVQDKIIDDNTIRGYIEKLNPHDKNKEIASLINYYDLLTSTDPSIVKIELDSAEYGNKYGFRDGECTLYLREGENLNRRVLMTRSAGMSLFEQDRFSRNVDFTGVLMIEGQEMNRIFKDMEVPSHDAWAPGRCKSNTKFYHNVFMDLKRYLRDQIVKYFSKPALDTIDAFGASDFLPDIPIEGAANQSNNQPSFMEKLQNLIGNEVRPARKRTRPLKIAEEKGEDLPPNKNKLKTPNPKPKDKNPKEINFKEEPIQPRTICTEATTGAYRVKFIVPRKSKQGRLDFMLSGEQNDFNVNLSDVRIVSSATARIIGFEENQLSLENLSAGEQLVIDINIDFDDYCMMEVQYYATKK